MSNDAYKDLAVRLDQLPNGFPATEDGAELRLLAYLFSPQEAKLATKLRITLETPEQITERLKIENIDGNLAAIKKLLKGMARKGLIKAGKTETGMGFGLLPFVVGIYEYQIARIDKDLAELFEAYYRQAFGTIVAIQPTFHRVVPIGETVKVNMEVRPYESATEIVNQAKAWGVMDCICRKQKSLLGDPCNHPVEMCMVFSSVEGAFDHNQTIRALDLDGAHETLKQAARAGLVHTVSNNQRGTYYICNCCTCSCGLLRGMAEMGIANAVARSVFVNSVDEELCHACETCVEYCQFDALELDNDFMTVDRVKCVGCGVCVPACPESALSLDRRPVDEIMAIPETEDDWYLERAAARGIDIQQVR